MRLRPGPPGRRYRERVTALTRPRGPLPRRVYWTRRVLVLVVALGLVVGISRLLQTGGSGAPEETAATVGSTPTTSDDVSASVTPEVTTPVEPRKKHKKKQPLPEPDGPCDPADLVVSPRVPRAHAGDAVKIVLDVSTKESPACTWDLSPDEVFVTIANENATIWSSQQCPQVIPTEQLVPRKKKADKATFLWDGKASDASCSAATDWAVMGAYTIDAVARGATDPQDSVFVIGGPTRGTVTVTPTPTPTPTPTDEADPEKDKKKDGRRAAR